MNQLPQEIVNEIIGFVPEYGFLVNKNLHDLIIKNNDNVSYYCDYPRFESLLHEYGSDIHNAISSYHDIIPKLRIRTLDDGFEPWSMTIRYLQENVHAVLMKYIKDRSWLKDLLIFLGIKNLDKITPIYDWYGDHPGIKRIAMIYSSVILHENGLLSDEQFASIDIDKDILKDIIQSFDSCDHIREKITEAFKPMIPSICKELFKEYDFENISDLEDTLDGIGYTGESLWLCRKYKNNIPTNYKDLPREELIKIIDEINDHLEHMMY